MTQNKPTYGTKTVRYTKDELDSLTKELKESKDAVTLPNFYEDWNMVTLPPRNKRKVNG